MRGRMIHFREPRSKRRGCMTEQSLQRKSRARDRGSSGLGRDSRSRSRGAGAKVFLAARREEKLREVVRGDHARPAARPRTTSWTCASCPRSTTSSTCCSSRFRRLDILVNNAGLGYPFAAARDAALRDRRDARDQPRRGDLPDAGEPARAPEERARRTSSTSPRSRGLEGFAEGTVYCAAKAGLVGFTRALAHELKPANIRVTAICPGSVETEFFERFRPTLDRPQMLRIEDAVRALLYVLTLASERAPRRGRPPPAGRVTRTRAGPRPLRPL